MENVILFSINRGGDKYCGFSFFLFPHESVFELLFQLQFYSALRNLKAEIKPFFYIYFSLDSLEAMRIFIKPHFCCRDSSSSS